MTDRQFMNADGALIEISVEAGPLLAYPLSHLVTMARFASYAAGATCGRSASTGEPCPEHTPKGGEVLAFSYQPPPDLENPEAPLEPRRYARLIVEELPAPDAPPAPPPVSSPEYGGWLAAQYRHVPLPAPTGPVLHFHGAVQCPGHDSAGDVPLDCPEATS